MSKTFNITVLPGDGIGKVIILMHITPPPLSRAYWYNSKLTAVRENTGPEVVDQAIRVLETISEKGEVKFNLESYDFGGIAIDNHQDPLPDKTLDACKRADAVLMGKSNTLLKTSQFNNVLTTRLALCKIRPEQGLLKLRKELGLYANIRPANFASDSLVTSSPLKDTVAKGVDFIVVRELIGGLYFGKRKEEDENMPEAKGLTSIGHKSVGDVGVAWDTMVYSVEEVERITRVAAKIALGSTPPLKIHSVDKANVLASSRLWRRVVGETIKNEFPELEVDHGLVDSVAMVMVQNPRKLNGVILTENMFGDIECDSGLVGAFAVCFVGGCTYAVAGTTTFGLYEPIHGSAPDIAGQGIANPIGTILSAAMLLRYSLGLDKEAKAIENAVRKVLDTDNGGFGYRSKDLGGDKGTKEIGDKIVGSAWTNETSAPGSDLKPKRECYDRGQDGAKGIHVEWNAPMNADWTRDEEWGISSREFVRVWMERLELKRDNPRERAGAGTRAGTSVGDDEHSADSHLDVVPRYPRGRCDPDRRRRNARCRCSHRRNGNGNGNGSGNASGNGNGTSGPPVYESKRAPRKSKTEAMAAINQRSMSPESRLRQTMNIPAPKLNPRFDMSTVNTKSVPPPRTTPRLMGLEECPVFYPTADEFRDPMTYIRSIHEKAVPHGIIKIVPPQDWEMPFVCDTQTFRFKTRLQRLNSIEASSRAKMSFLEQLYRYHDQGANRPSVPLINHQPLDLWLLRREVQRRGGYDTVSRNKLWGDVQRAMGYTGPSVLAAQLKAAYTRIISPYEVFRAQVRHDPSPNRDRRVQPPRSSGRTSRSRVFPSTAATPPSSPLTPSSSPLSEPPDDADPQASQAAGADVKMKPPKDEGANAFSKALAQDPGPSMTFDNTPLPNPAPPAPPVRKGEMCELCLKGDRDTEMLLCDGCDEGFHMSCLDPPWMPSPKAVGDEHSLTSFQQRDLQFRKSWFEKHPPSGEDPTRIPIGDSDIKVSEDDVEREFWRLVQSSHETVEVEYGADVHSTTHGSAMPSVESHPRDPYSRDPWNVNNLPILQDSMLRYIKSDISGMTVPWTYVGMLFSTFCWHNECTGARRKHGTASQAKMHKNSKTRSKSEAPDLFEAQPDLLFQLVTLMNPDRLRKAGVRVFACNQRPGEFVVTLPKAYHAGFNHGELMEGVEQLNFNEAVNFALPEWLPLGLECAKRYQEHRKLPVFSHDELLVTVVQHALSVKNAQWLLPNFKEMVDRELEQRAILVSQPGGILGETLDESDRPEEQYQCSVCKVFCYLSQVTCACTTAVACLSHAKEMCNCHVTRRILRRRFSDDWLQDTLNDIEAKARAPTLWRERFVEVVTGPDLPSVSVLRQLVTEGEALEIPMMELKALQRCVKRAAEWSDQATQLLDYRLLDEIKKLGVDAPEKARLETLLEQVNDFQQKTQLLTMGKNLRLELDELTKARAARRAITVFPNPVDYQRQRSHPGPSDDRAESQGDVWGRVEDPGGFDFGPAETDDAGSEPAGRPRPVDPTLPDILDKLDRARLKGREYEKRVEGYLRPQHRGQVSIDEANKCAVAALKEVFFQSAEELRVLSNEAKLWEKSCEDIFTGRYTPRTSKGTLEDIYAMREEGKSKFWAFKMPWFERLLKQLGQHDEWITRLPWTRPKHPALEMDAIQRDLSSTDLGNAPPPDETCTCLCIEPVVLGEGQSAADMEVVQCDHCLAKFHAKCIEGSCPFCDHHHWNGSMNKPRKFTYIQLVSLYKAAGEISLGQQGSPDPASLPQIRHFMRKLYRIQFDITPANNTSFGLSLAHLHRTIAMQPTPKTSKRRMNRKPKFVFKSEIDSKAEDGTRCLCGGAATPLNLELITCGKCMTLYHVACVAFSSLDDAPDPYVCPLCLLKKGKPYGPADVRVKYPADDDPEEAAKFVDVKACLDNYSSKLIRRSLPSPHRTTITVQLYHFVPGTNPDVDEPELSPTTPSKPSNSSPRKSLSGNSSQETPNGQTVVRRVRLRVNGSSASDEVTKSPTSDTSPPGSAQINGR
ncbi:BRIGHT, ARID (A/T-rich interaction domain) domain [Rhizoctonia solani]|uniref:BRIGHT, ARID (A/T-rich interaction domain) domain n=1 Tax=Rhizoctonia solani TaxID=456999 RepID=A0A8H7INJ7_9AGAM|nr:BRIGHT, ARID (A/T-rich interaction domain) domain [Rhizoctonia solani]